MGYTSRFSVPYFDTQKEMNLICVLKGDMQYQKINDLREH